MFSLGGDSYDDDEPSQTNFTNIFDLNLLSLGYPLCTPQMQEGDPMSKSTANVHSKINGPDIIELA
jgi:hypothetical protein